jgi:hypothetical protein
MKVEQEKLEPTVADTCLVTLLSCTQDNIHFLKAPAAQVHVQ